MQTEIPKDLNIHWVDIDSIKPFAGNPRKIATAIPEVKKSLQSFGWQQPIVVDPDSLEIIAGTVRWHSAKELYLTQVPVTYMRQSEANKRAYRVMDNRTNEFAAWDKELLLNEINEVKILDPDMDAKFLGFDLINIDERTEEEKWDYGKVTDKFVITIQGDLKLQPDVISALQNIQGIEVETAHLKQQGGQWVDQDGKRKTARKNKTQNETSLG
jgi:hypothetical protein